MTPILARRAVLALASAAVLAGPALAADAVKVVDADRVFPYLAKILSLPAGERSRIVVGYYLFADGKPATATHLTFAAGADRWAVPIAADGHVERLPTLKELSGEAKVTVQAPAGTKHGVALAIDANLKPAPELEAADLTAALSQATAASHKVAGMLGFAAPSFERVVFHGVASGEAVGADGRATPLGLDKGMPVFDPAATPGARRLRFPKAPERIELAPRK